MRPKTAVLGSERGKKVKILITIILMGFTVFTVNDSFCPSTLTSSKLYIYEEKKRRKKNILALILEGRQWRIRQQQAVFLPSWQEVNVFLHAILVTDPADLT